MIQFASEEMFPSLMEIWQSCFGDDEGYIRFFFRHFPPEEHTLVYTMDSAPVAMLNLLPMEVVHSSGTVFEGRYIYGVATHPNHRNQGYSKALLADVHKRLRQQKIALSVLVPASMDLFEFYGKQGFVPAFYQNFLSYGSPVPFSSMHDYDLSPCDCSTYLEMRELALKDHPLFVRWDAEGLAYRLKETALLGGQTLLLESQNQKAAVICFSHDHHLLVKEYLSAGLPLEQGLAILQRIFQPDSLSVRLPAKSGEEHVLPYGMAYWYDQNACSCCGDSDKDNLLPYINLVLD